MSQQFQHQIRQNKILSILPEPLVAGMNLELVELSAGQVLADVGQDLQHVYFPLTSIVAWMKMLENGNTIGVAMLGRQGMVSLFAMLTGRHNRNFKAVVQIGGHALRAPLQTAHRVVQSDTCCGNSQLMRYADMRMATVAQNSLCMRNHTLEQQLSRFFSGDARPDRRSGFQRDARLDFQLVGRAARSREPGRQTLDGHRRHRLFTRPHHGGGPAGFGATELRMLQSAENRRGQMLREPAGPFAGKHFRAHTETI